MYRVQYACVCQKGKIRKTNQDNITWKECCLPPGDDGFTDPVSGSEPIAGSMLFGVFDGMGGEERGEAAAYIAARTAAERSPAESAAFLPALCHDINREICAFTLENKLSVCGTTAAMLLIGPDSVSGCNIGDSRIYRCKGHILTQLSEDHVLPMYPGRKPPLTQFLGIPETEMLIEPFCFTRKTVQAGTYLICSDGLTDMVPDSVMENLLSESAGIPEKAKRLLDAALSAGGRDNISFILLDITGTVNT